MSRSDPGGRQTIDQLAADALEHAVRLRNLASEYRNAVQSSTLGRAADILCFLAGAALMGALALDERPHKETQSGPRPGGVA